MTSYKEPLVRFSGNRLITTSLAVSQHFGKKHQHVLEAIRNLDCSQDFNASNFRPITYTDGRGRQKPAYEITRDGFSFLCMGFTGAVAAAWKEKYIAAFNAMEQELQQPASRLETHMAQLAAGMNTLPYLCGASMIFALRGISALPKKPIMPIVRSANILSISCTKVGAVMSISSLR